MAADLVALTLWPEWGAEVWPKAMRLADQFEGVGAARIAAATFGPPAPS